MAGVFYFDDSSDAYNGSQCRDEIADGDILIGKRDRAVAILVKAWPVSITRETRANFHGLETNVTWDKYERGHYLDSFRQAADLLTALEHTATDAGFQEPADDWLFTLKFELSSGPVTITAWDADHTDPFSGHQRIDAELQQNGEVVFPRGATYCAVARGTKLDQTDARELVGSLFAMRPGDTDEDFFESYTPAQRAWAEANGEELGCEVQARFCDDNGNPVHGRL
jgi:hypothetical protein